MAPSNKQITDGALAMAAGATLGLSQEETMQLLEAVSQEKLSKETKRVERAARPLMLPVHVVKVVRLTSNCAPCLVNHPLNTELVKITTIKTLDIQFKPILMLL